MAELDKFVVRFFIIFDVMPEVVSVEVAIGQGSDSHQAEQVGYHVSFYFQVERRVSVHGG